MLVSHRGIKIINGSSKFRPTKEDPTLSREGRLQRLLRKLKQELMASPNYTRILEPTLLRHFAPSCLLLEHIIITWLNIFAIFYRLTFQPNIVLLTLSLLYSTSNLFLCLVNLWCLSMSKVFLRTYP